MTGGCVDQLQPITRFDALLERRQRYDWVDGIADTLTFCQCRLISLTDADIAVETA
ncbi:hypothetical protein BSY17_3354 (plasmid) [Sphingobium sp. RAC03]|nr:hypothetical protein BSY17_3354 [Sphingobium sp. RAC03]